ncbi:phage regulatory CII family protein [Pararoseomonas indoligenes]|uniref:Uncharacterized protein n=1 Tax=Roseomonas indoligenes TaxID=2820811 RepID=A0A940S7G2_9PROT|nr:phage regulatory CII family protein [Pararoseomonas indoligenes]MBP0493047.1 hypothetical protein [Pararoseomonas indoligenes]
MSPSSPDLAFKTLVRALVERVGGLDAAAACTRVRRAQLSNYQSLNVDDAFVPVDVIWRLERIAGEPLITQELANRAGYTIVAVEPIAEGELAALLAKVGAESGHVFSAFAEAMADDGQVNAQERGEIARELQDLIRAASRALGHLQAPLAPVPAQVEQA